MKFQLDQLEDFNEGNVEKWYKDIVSTSEILLEDQEKIMRMLDSGEKIENDDDDQGILKDSDEEEEVAVPQKRPTPTTVPAPPQKSSTE